MHVKAMLVGIVTVLCGLIIGISSIVPDAKAAAWGLQTRIVSHFYYSAGNTVYVKLATMQNPDGCGSNAYLLMDLTDLRAKEMYALIVATQTSGAEVSVHYDGCVGGYPKIGGLASPSVW